LQGVEPAAAAMGAVNCIRNEGGLLHGTNTDGEGFLLSLRHDLRWNPAGKRVLLLGAGAAELWIANRTLAHAEALAGECAAHHREARVTALALETAGGHAPHLLVNSTTVGMGGGGSPVALAALGVQEAVVDIVYHPLLTPLLAQAKALGLPCTNGVGMLLYQGVAAFRFWTGQDPPEAVMRAALEAALAARHG